MPLLLDALELFTHLKFKRSNYCITCVCIFVQNSHWTRRHWWHAQWTISERCLCM